MARARRSPEEARSLILDAARKVLLDRGPDKVRLKEVAKRAGISHGLITHYFGTIDRLVEETFATFVRQMRGEWIERLASQQNMSLEGTIDAFFESIGHPLYGRLVAWGMLTKRFERDDDPVMRDRGIERAVDAVEARAKALGANVTREDLEHTFLVVMCSALGYRLGRMFMWRGLGRTPSAERDAEFRRKLAAMIRAYLDLPDELA